MESSDDLFKRCYRHSTAHCGIHRCTPCTRRRLDVVACRSPAIADAPPPRAGRRAVL